jgi:hypothetical protein
MPALARGRHTLAMRFADRRVPQRRLDLGWYRRTVTVG